MKIVKLFTVLFLSVMATGCMTMQTPPYEAAIGNYEQMQDSKYKKVVIGDFSISDNKLNMISVRGNPLKSSISDSFGTYLKSALEEECYKAGLLLKESKCNISGMILENDIDTGFDTASGHISAKVVIVDNEQIIFEKVIKATHQWESSFVGAVAIPRARDNYPFVIRKFINKLFEDDDFKLAMLKN